MARIARGLHLVLLLLLPGCESLGITAHVTSWKTENGKTTVKHREAKNWDEFKEAMSEVGTDFSDVAKKMGEQTATLVKTLVDAPPPGEVNLGDLSPTLASWQGKDGLDFLSMARKKQDAGYDFRYVRIGEQAYDDFFKAAAEAYALSFMRRECARRIKKLGAGLLGVEESSLKDADPSAVAEKALATEKDGAEDAHLYLEKLKELHSALNDNPLLGAARVSDLVTTGQKLAASAPSSITNPKVLLHVKLVVEGIEQSVKLIRDAAASEKS